MITDQPHKMEKETFILRTEWYDSIQELDDKCKAELLDNLFLFHLNEETKINLNNLSVKLVWKLIEPNLRRNIDSYDKRKSTSSENGKKGGRPPKNQTLIKYSENLNNLKKPNESLSVSVSVSDIDNNVLLEKEPKECVDNPSEFEFLKLENEALKKKLDEEKRKKVPPKKENIFRPPSEEEVRQYCHSRQNGINANEFCDFYASKGWMIGKNKMIDWQSAVRTWERTKIKSTPTLQNQTVHKNR